MTRSPYTEPLSVLNRPLPASTWVPLLGIMALLVLVIARSWLCDDAYITWRTVDNLVHGYGARWNIADRVQAYTHPLWMLLLVLPYAAMREPYFSALVLALLCTAVAIAVVVYGVAATTFARLWVCVALAFCTSFVDFSTGGLENPLTHALLAWLRGLC